MGLNKYLLLLVDEYVNKINLINYNGLFGSTLFPPLDRRFLDKDNPFVVKIYIAGYNRH